MTNTPTTITDHFTVTCPNGTTHSFATRADALRWAEYGHICLSVASHRIEADADTEAFQSAYVEALIWQSTDDDVSAMHHEGFGALDADAVAEVLADCDDFLTPEVRALITRALATEHGYSWSQAGHDLALTRNGHGAGYWDRGLGQLGEDLSEAAATMGDADLWWDGETCRLRAQ